MKRLGMGVVCRRMVAAAAMALAAGGCAHERASRVSDAAQKLEYRVGREDVIEVSVYRDADLTRTVPVRPDGRISLPIVGEIEAAGRTVDELRQEVVERLNPYVKDPTIVSLIVREVNASRFYVVGEVTRPGAFPLRGEVSALQALALAGGLGDFSARDTLTIVRAGGERFNVSLKDLWKGDSHVLLWPGDTLVVR